MKLSVRLKTVNDLPEIYPLVLQIASAPSRQDAEDLWRIGEQATEIDGADVCRAVEEVYFRLTRLFGFSVFESIDWCVGHWTQGAVSLAHSSRIRIFSGSRTLTHRLAEVEHIVQHEIFHYFLRHVLDPDLHHSDAEEEIVQYHSRWEFSQNRLKTKARLLDQCRLSIFRRDWPRLNEVARELAAS